MHRVPSIVRWCLACMGSSKCFTGERTPQPRLGRGGNHLGLGLRWVESRLRLGFGQDESCHVVVWCLARARQKLPCCRPRPSLVFIETSFVGTFFAVVWWLGFGPYHFCFKKEIWDCYDPILGALVYGTRQCDSLANIFINSLSASTFHKCINGIGMRRLREL